MQRERVVLVGGAELDVAPRLSDSAELVGMSLGGYLGQRLDNVIHLAKQAVIPFDGVPSEYDRASLFLEIAGLDV